MREHTTHLQQQALLAGIRSSDARARRRSTEIVLEIWREYDPIRSFLERINPLLDEYSELNRFYFPIESQQVLCVYSTAEHPQPIPVEFRGFLADTRRHARELYNQIRDKRFHSFSHPPLDIRGGVGDDLSDNESSGDNPPIINLILATLGGHLPRPYPKGAESLIICCSVEEALKDAVSRLRALAGVLILFGDKQSFPQTSHPKLADEVMKEFGEYLYAAGRHAAFHDLDFFLTSLTSQDERIQDNTMRALGLFAHMIVHRFRNLRQVASSIAEEFSTAEDVASNPHGYWKRVRDMQSQIDKGQRLENQLSYLGERPEKIQQTVDEVHDIFRFVFERAKAHFGNSMYLTVDIPEEFNRQSILIPVPGVLEEVFNNHIENIIEEFRRSDLEDQRVTLRVNSEAGNICFDLIHYGSTLPPDVLEDLQRVVRVRHPRGSGLGMFLSAMIMRHIGGDQVVNSPVSGSSKGVCVTLKFPRVTG